MTFVHLGSGDDFQSNQLLDVQKRKTKGPFPRFKQMYNFILSFQRKKKKKSEEVDYGTSITLLSVIKLS